MSRGRGSILRRDNGTGLRCDPNTGDAIRSAGSEKPPARDATPSIGDATPSTEAATLSAGAAMGIV